MVSPPTPEALVAISLLQRAREVLLCSDSLPVAAEEPLAPVSEPAFAGGARGLLRAAHAALVRWPVRRGAGAATEGQAHWGPDIAEQGGPTGGPTAEGERTVTTVEVLKQARHLLLRSHSAYRRAIAATLPESVSRAKVLLAQFAGFPRRINAMRIWGIDRLEAAPQAVLAWLLDPRDTHGLGDLFVRHFLARIGLSLRGRVFDLNTTLAISIVKEFAWEMPQGSLSPGANDDREESPTLRDSTFGEAGKRLLRVDILLSAAGVMVPIEVKWEAEEWVYFFAEREGARTPLFQAELYARVLELATRSGPALGESFDFKKAIRHALGRRIGEENARARLAQTERVVGVLVGATKANIGRYGPTFHRSTAAAAARASPANIRTLNWFDIAEILYELLRDGSLPRDTGEVMHTFRDAIYQRFGGQALVEALRGLRLQIGAGLGGRLVERSVEFERHLEVLQACLGLSAPTSAYAEHTVAE